MNYTEFGAKINPLVNRFNRAYNGDLLALVFKEVENLTLSDFERLVTYFLGSSRVAPLVQDFRKAIIDLGLKPQFTKKEAMHLDIVKNNGSFGIDWEYPIKPGVWANSRYIFLRGEKTHRFIIKSECVDEELLKADRDAEKRHVSILDKISDSTKYGARAVAEYYRDLSLF